MLKCATRLTVVGMAVAVIALSLAPLTAADAAEKISHPTAKYKRVVKKNRHGMVNAAKLKKSTAHPNRTVTGSRQARKASLRLSPDSLTLAKDIKLTPASAAIPQQSATRKDANESEAPPLQIGRTLYLRNGEVHLRESGNSREISNKPSTSSATDKPGLPVRSNL